MRAHVQYDYTSHSALVFDSGVGGLTIATALRRAAPELSISYAADTGFFPYGEKSDADLRARLPEIARLLYDRVRPDVFVIACNTASTLALSDVRAALPIPVVGTVPAIKPAAEMSQSGVIGLLATPGTIRRKYTDWLISEYASDTNVIKLGSIRLVELAEAVARGEQPPLSAFAAAQAPLFESPAGKYLDTIVLACTHFPLARQQLIDTAPRPITYIDSGDAIARQTLKRLAENSPRGGGSTARAYVTSSGQDELAQVFARFGFERTVMLTGSKLSAYSA